MVVASKSKLRETGLRVTRQRAVILDIIGKGHLAADEIYLRARKKEPRLNLSTVYRTLQKLKEQGLVEEIHLDGSHHHYEVKPVSEHYHLVCLSCGRVQEIHYPFLRNLKKQVPEARDFALTETEVRLAGYCQDCQRAGAAGNTGKAEL
ncbi:Fur family transcriptional regulator [Chloroflexota bacterium]